MQLPLLLVLTLSAVAFPSNAKAQGFSEPRRMLPSFQEDINVDVRTVLFADFNGDGHQDAFLGAYSGQPATNRILLNDGSGTFLDATSQVSGPLDGRTLCAAAGDLDHDGDLDLYVGNSSGVDEIWWNLGSGGFQISRLGQQTQERTTDVAIGDLNGDTFVDLFLTFGGDSYGVGDPDQVRLNDGFGNFQTPGQLPILFEASHAVDLGDVDGDGDLDALVGTGSGAFSLEPHLYINQGGGDFLDAPLQLPNISGNFQDVRLVDVDSDGDLDAFLANSAFLEDQLYINPGNGNFVNSNGQIPALQSSSLTMFDFDQDGDLDALLDRVLLENNGFGIFFPSPATFPSMYAAVDVAAADVDGDGDADLLVANNMEGTQLLLCDGVRAYHDVSSTWPASSRYSDAVDAGDVDGDGDVDLFFGREWGENHLLLNDGTGRYAYSPYALPHGFERTRSMDFADFDGDGDLDIFLTNGSFSGGYPAEPDRLYLNNGAGKFQDATSQLPNVVVHSRESDLGDLDQDGDIDILIAVYEGPDRMYLNDGLGNFTDLSSQLPSPSENSLDAHLLDIDGDGDLDAYIAHSGSDRLYLNQGGAVFVEDSSRIAPTPEVSYAVTSGDIDGDGDLDIVVGRYASGNKAYRLLRNHGAGQFTEQNHRLPVSDAFDGLALEFADVNADGALDLYVASSNNDALLLNNGVGFFTDASSFLNAHWDGSMDVVAADLDGDEDVDFAVAQGRMNRIHINNTRQLTWASVPRVGQPLRLELRGEANTAFTLVGSTLPGNRVVPAYGTLHLSYPDRFLQVSGLLDAEGYARWESPMLMPQGYAGATFYWQALLGTSPRLSNLERTKITLW